MAYVDRQSGAQRAASLATATIIQGAIGAVLVYGLATEVFLPPKDPPLKVSTFRTPPPQPSETPKETRQDTKSFVTAPKPLIDIVQPAPGPVAIPTQAPADPGFVIPKPIPTFAVTPAPKPQFTTKPARPAGDQSRWVTTDDYPAGEIRRGHTGVTRYRVAIGTNGRVTNCDVVKSSGWPALDQSACSNLTRRAKFDPGTDETGAKGGSYTGSVVWTLPDN